MTSSHLSSLRFDELALAEPVARGVAEAGFSHCTPNQADTLLFENFIACYPNGDLWYRPHELIVEFVEAHSGKP